MMAFQSQFSVTRCLLWLLLLILYSCRANSKLGTDTPAYSKILMSNIHFVSSTIMKSFNNIFFFHQRCSLWHLETLLKLSVPNHCFPNVQDTYSLRMVKSESWLHLKNLTFIEICSLYKITFHLYKQFKKFQKL